ncbi:FAD-binding domain-containing protein [Gigaspora margarita]|uniref:D-arabinono-1,4-lactone oxidase n=1 Tax=Gigaspora margarita TaxID=4874 RepID=A0A8H4A2I2_GIGMA|nr:FAD-binding domain-containing protein [Gigaspora margarita]
MTTMKRNKGLVIRSAIPIENKTWENWNGQIHIFPNAIFEPSTLEDLIDIVKLAKINNKTIRCAAQGHTTSSLSVTKNYLVVVTNLNKVTVQHNPKYGWTATAEAGTSLSDFDNVLRNYDPPLTIDSATVYNTFRVSGVIATGSHGAKSIMPDQLCSMKIVTSSGEVCEFSEEINESEFNAAKLNLGLLGIIYSLTFRVQPMYNLRLTDKFIPNNEWLNPKNIQNLLESSDAIGINYFPFNGFNQSDPNSLDPNRDQIWIKYWVRTDEPVSFTQQQLEQSRKSQRQGAIQQYELRRSLIQNSEATPNISAKLWNDLTSKGNTSFVYQAPDAIHYVVSEEGVKFNVMEVAFKVSPDFSNVITEYFFIMELLYDFARKGKFPINMPVEFRFIKSSEALLSITFNKDPEELYCFVNVMTVPGTPNWEEFTQLIAQRLFDKYKAKPHWAKDWEFIPNVRSYLSEVLSDQIKQFEKVRAKYDPDKMFFDNNSLQDIFSKSLDSQNGKDQN